MGAMFGKMHGVGVLVLLMVAPGCSKGEGAACFGPGECAEGLACVGEGLMRCEKCEELKLCKIEGRCTAKEGRCIAASDQDCAQSGNCKGLGPCTAKDGVCVVGSDADCKQSTACAEQKFCVQKGNNCVRSEADKKALAKEAAKKAAAAKKKLEGEAEKAEETD